MVKTLYSSHQGCTKQLSYIVDRPSEQIVWLGTSPIKWGIQSQITCSKALLQPSCRENWVRT